MKDIKDYKDIIYTPIEEAHLEQVTAIYNYYVENTTVSFHTEPLTLDEVRDSVIHPNPRFKSFVIEQGSEIAGYVLITQHKKKQAYDVSGEVTIYLKPDCVGQGLGGKALHFIEEVARAEKFHTLVATVCLDNERSKSVFERNGFQQCAHYKEIGYKFGRRLDILTFQKTLGD